VSTHLLGDSDDFERGFALGVVWQQLRAMPEHTSVVLPRSLVAMAVRLGQATGYHATVRRPPGLPGLRFVRFRSVRR
jgi:hypothetical protein